MGDPDDPGYDPGPGDEHGGEGFSIKTSVIFGSCLVLLVLEFLLCTCGLIVNYQLGK